MTKITDQGSRKMKTNLSKRLADIVDALPLKENMRVLEIGCGPGAMAREISRKIGNGHVLAIDRSAKAILQAISGSEREIAAGRLTFRQVAVEEFELEPKEEPFELAVAVRVGALDGRNPGIEDKALTKIAKAVSQDGKLLVEKGNFLKEIRLDKYR